MTKCLVEVAEDNGLVTGDTNVTRQPDKMYYFRRHIKLTDKRFYLINKRRGRAKGIRQCRKKTRLRIGDYNNFVKKIKSLVK